MLAILTIGISILLIILIMVSTFITGIYALSVFKLLYMNGIITKGEQVNYSGKSFIFGLDIISAIRGYKVIKEKNNYLQKG